MTNDGVHYFHLVAVANSQIDGPNFHDIEKDTHAHTHTHTHTHPHIYIHKQIYIHIYEYN